MEGEHTPETNLILRPIFTILQFYDKFEGMVITSNDHFEEGERFESSDLRLERWCFLALLRVDTHLFQALGKELRLPSVGFGFHEAKASCFRTTASPQASVNQGR